MDQTIRDLIIGVASNGLWSLLAEVGVRTVRKVREQDSGPDQVAQHLRDAVGPSSNVFRLAQGLSKQH